MYELTLLDIVKFGVGMTFICMKKRRSQFDEVDGSACGPAWPAIARL